MKYTFRKSALEKPKTYSLIDEALAVSGEDVQTHFIPYKKIASIRLYYKPQRFRTYNYICKVEGSTGNMVIKSTSYVSVGEFSDNRYSYKKFVTALVENTRANNPNAKIYAGNTAIAYWLYVFITTITVFGLVGLFMLIPIPGGFGFIIGLILVAYYLFYSLKMFAKNYPRPITGTSIPDKVLPK